MAAREGGICGKGYKPPPRTHPESQGVWWITLNDIVIVGHGNFLEHALSLVMGISVGHIEGHFTHKTESPWPLHFKHSHWWKRWCWSKFASHYAWGDQRSMWLQDGCEVYLDWIPTWHRMDHVSWSLGFFLKPPLGGRPNTKPGGDHGTSNTHNDWFILIYHAWGVWGLPAWIGIHWNSIWLRARSHMTSH